MGFLNQKIYGLNAHLKLIYRDFSLQIFKRMKLLVSNRIKLFVFPEIFTRATPRCDYKHIFNLFRYYEKVGNISRRFLTPRCSTNRLNETKF